MIREITLTYRTGVVPDDAHLLSFMGRLEQHCRERGIGYKLAAIERRTLSGNPYWLVLAEVPLHWSVPHLDKAGLWPHGMTQVVRLRGQVAADAAGWFAGLYARWSICAPPEFLTHSRSSAPDTFPGVSQ